MTSRHLLPFFFPPGFPVSLNCIIIQQARHLVIIATLTPYALTYIQSTLFKIVVAILGGNGKKQQPLSYPGHHSVYHRLTWPMATDLSPVLIFSNWLHTAYLYRRPQKILGNAICLYHLSSKILDCL